MARANHPVPPRGMWSGTISFGLVSVPVALYPALRRRPVHLRMLAEDGTPLRRQYVCPAHDKALESEEIARGYELEDGRMIVVGDDELEALSPEKSNDIKLSEFVDMKQIAEFHYDRPYFLAPAGGSSNAYRLLAHVMEKHGRAGIASFVMRGKEYLVAIIAEGGLLMAETMRFADELRDPDEVGLPQRQPAPEQLVAQLRRAVDDLKRDTLDESELTDDYTTRFQRLVGKKRKLRKAVVHTDVEEEEEAESNVIDLVAVFKERMREAEAETRAEGEGGELDLSRLSKAELYERAQAVDIPGRSKMSKEELAQALSA